MLHCSWDRCARNNYRQRTPSTAPYDGVAERTSSTTISIRLREKERTETESYQTKCSTGVPKTWSRPFAIGKETAAFIRSRQHDRDRVVRFKLLWGKAESTDQSYGLDGVTDTQWPRWSISSSLGRTQRSHKYRWSSFNTSRDASNSPGTSRWQRYTYNCDQSLCGYLKPSGPEAHNHNSWPAIV